MSRPRTLLLSVWTSVASKLVVVSLDRSPPCNDVAVTAAAANEKSPSPTTSTCPPPSHHKKLGKVVQLLCTCGAGSSLGPHCPHGHCRSPQHSHNRSSSSRAGGWKAQLHCGSRSPQCWHFWRHQPQCWHWRQRCPSHACCSRPGPRPSSCHACSCITSLFCMSMPSGVSRSISPQSSPPSNINLQALTGAPPP